MRNASSWCLVLAIGLVSGCEGEAGDEAAESPAHTVVSAPSISLAEIAGTWSMRYVPESGDTTAVTKSQIQVTSEGWTLQLADRAPVEGMVTISGDSILVIEGPYESVRRAGVMVTTTLLILRSEGTRAP